MKVRRKVVKKIMAFTLAGLLSIQSMPLLTNATTTGSFSTPVLSCSFDNGTAADTSGYSNNGTFKGTTLPTAATGMNKSGLAFSNSGYVEVPNSATLNFGTGDFSVTFWIKTSVSDQVIFDKRDSNGIGYHMTLYSGVPLLQVAQSSSKMLNFYNTSIPVISDNVWHFVTFSVDRDSTTGVKLYVDGALKGTMNPTSISGTITNAANLLIGKHKDGGYFTGNLDEFKIYNRVIEPKEIQKLYLKPYTCGYWSFDGGIYDTSGNGNTGEISTDTLGYLYDRFGNSFGSKLFNYNANPLTVQDNPTLNVGTGDFSISFWYIYNPINDPNIASGTKTILDKRSNETVGYHICIYQGVPLIQLGDSTGTLNYYDTTLPTVNDSQWHMVTYSVDRDSTTGLKLYVDGVLKKQFNPTGKSGNLNNNSPLYLGAHSSLNQSSALTGRLDDFGIYNKALTDTEVTTLFNQANTVSPTNTPTNTPVSSSTNTPTKTPTPTNTPTNTPTKTPTPTPLASAVAIWKFDNTLSDTSGNGNNLTTSSTAAYYIQGIRNQAFNVDKISTNCSMQAPNSASLNLGTGDFTITSWVKTSTEDLNKMLIVNKGFTDSYAPADEIGYQFCLFNGYPTLEVHNPKYNSFSCWDRVDDGLWHFLAVTVDRDAVDGSKMYIDGVLVNQSSQLYENNIGTFNLTNTATTAIGMRGTTCTPFMGCIDETRIYKRVLSQAEITSLYQN